MSDYKLLYSQIGYTFVDESLLTLALTHSSVGDRNYERLEFLGDALLDFTVGEYLYRRFPDKAEGELTKLRAQLVSNAVLSRLFADLDIAGHIRSQNLSLSRLSEKVRANFIESMLGAIFLDGGMDTAVQFVHKYICTDAPISADYVSRLYELCAIDKKVLEVKEESVGTVNKPRFSVSVTVDGRTLAVATADSIKRAKQAACQEALIALE